MRVYAAAKFVPAFHVHTVNSNLSGNQKPKTKKSGTNVLLGAITSEVYRIRNGWNLEVFCAVSFGAKLRRTTLSLLGH